MNLLSLTYMYASLYMYHGRFAFSRCSRTRSMNDHLGPVKPRNVTERKVPSNRYKWYLLPTKVTNMHRNFFPLFTTFWCLQELQRRDTNIFKHDNPQISLYKLVIMRTYHVWFFIVYFISLSTIMGLNDDFWLFFLLFWSTKYHEKEEMRNSPMHTSIWNCCES